MVLPMSAVRDSVTSQTVLFSLVQGCFGNVVLVIFKVGCFSIISLTVLHLKYFREFSEAQTFYKILFHIYAMRK
jgi:hypothetical protein